MPFRSYNTRVQFTDTNGNGYITPIWNLRIWYEPWHASGKTLIQYFHGEFARRIQGYQGYCEFDMNFANEGVDDSTFTALLNAIATGGTMVIDFDLSSPGTRTMTVIADDATAASQALFTGKIRQRPCRLKFIDPIIRSTIPTWITPPPDTVAVAVFDWNVASETNFLFLPNIDTMTLSPGSKGDYVTAWADQSGRGCDLNTQFTTPLEVDGLTPYPLYYADPTMDHAIWCADATSGANPWRTTIAVDGTVPANGVAVAGGERQTLMFIIRVPATFAANPLTIFGWGSALGTVTDSITLNTSGFGSENSSAAETYHWRQAGPILDDQIHLIEVLIDQRGEVHLHLIDGEIRTAVSVPRNGWGGVHLQVFDNPGSNAVKNVKLAMVASYNRLLTPAERRARYNEMTASYGVTMPDEAVAMGVWYSLYSGTAEQIRYTKIDDSLTHTCHTATEPSNGVKDLQAFTDLTLIGPSIGGTDGTRRFAMNGVLTTVKFSRYTTISDLLTMTGDGENWIWTGETSGAIRRQSYYDGVTKAILIADGTYVPVAMRYNPTDGLVYFIDTKTAPTLRKMNPDGTGVTSVATLTAGTYDCMTLDVENQIFYYTRSGNIGKINVNGTGESASWYTPANGPTGLDWEKGNSRLWYANGATGQIRHIAVSAGAAGTDTLFKSVGLTLDAIALHLAP